MTNIEIQKLNTEFNRIQEIMDPQSRGRNLEELITKLLRVFGWNAKRDVKGEGEQIDITASHNFNNYLLEIKWLKDKVQQKDIDILFGKLSRKPPNTRGIFLSMSGFTDKAIENTKKIIPQRMIILLDRSYILSALSGEDFNEIFEDLLRICSDEGKVYIPIGELIEQGKKPRSAKTFSKVIGVSNLKYKYINEIFVAPREYQEINKLLDENHIVFIIGDPHIGKTFTALNILYEYYLSGYSPKWYRLEEKERQVEDLLYHLERVLWGKKILYFEDPFGKIEYDSPESFLSELGNIISTVRNSSSKIIITSRERIFNVFKKKGEILDELDDLAKAIKLIHPSYDKQAIQQILKNYAKLYNAKWVSTANYLKISEFVSQELQAPHNIEGFVKDSKNDIDIDIIYDKIIMAKDIIRVFANEIINMLIEEKVLYSMIFILKDSKEYDDIKRAYSNFLSESCNKSIVEIETFWTQILERGDRYINLYIQYGQKNFRFAHPSYEEAYKLSLQSYDMKQIFSHCISIAYKQGHKASAITMIEKMPKYIQEDIIDDLLKDTIENLKPRDFSTSHQLIDLLKKNPYLIKESYRNILLSQLLDCRNTTIRRETLIEIFKFDCTHNAKIANKIYFLCKNNKIFLDEKATILALIENYKVKNKKFIREILLYLIRDDDIWISRKAKELLVG